MADQASTPSPADKQIKLLTHQAQNLESLKNDSTWFRGRVQSIDEAMMNAIERSCPASVGSGILLDRR